MVPSDVHAKFGADSPRNKKLLGTPFSPGRAGSGLRAGREPRGERRLTGPLSRVPWQQKIKSCRIRLKFGGRSLMVPSDVHAKFGADSPRNEKVFGTA